MRWSDVKDCVSHHCSRATQRAFEIAERETDLLVVEVVKKDHKYQAVFSANLGQGHSVYATITRNSKHNFSVVSESGYPEDKIPGFNDDTLEEIGKAFIRVVRKHGITG